MGKRKDWLPGGRPEILSMASDWIREMSAHQQEWDIPQAKKPRRLRRFKLCAASRESGFALPACGAVRERKMRAGVSGKSD